MKNLQKGFVIPLLLAIIALLLAGGAYVYLQQKQTNQPVIENSAAQTTSATSQSSAPIITRIAPNQGIANEVKTVTIYGTNLTGATVVNFYNANNLVVAGITPTNVAGDGSPSKDFFVAADGSSLQFVLKSAGAGYFIGALQVRVVTQAGTSNSLPFTITK